MCRVFRFRFFIIVNRFFIGWGEKGLFVKMFFCGQDLVKLQEIEMIKVVMIIVGGSGMGVDVVCWLKVDGFEVVIFSLLGKGEVLV